MSGHEVIWNDVSSTSIPELVCGQITRSLVGAHRGTFVDIPGKDSGWYFPEERGRRMITIDCHVMAESFADRRDAVTAVADWLDLNQQARLVLGDEPTVYYNAVLMDPPDVKEWREAGIFELKFSVEAYSYDLDATGYLWEAVNDTPEVVDFGLTAPTLPIIEITPTNGVSSLGFSLWVGGDILFYDGIVLAGETVTINGIALVVLAGSNDDTNLTGVYNPIDSLMGAVSGTFPTLLPGGQTLQIISTGLSTEFDVNFSYRKRYRR